MDPDFWHQRWQQQLIGFHQKETNRYLEKYANALNLQVGDTVFVPLCGKSLDMLWLHDRGYGVLGVELSPIACEAFFFEAGRHARKRKDGIFTSWNSSDIEILCGDFFDLSPEMLNHVRAFYDRAALIALFTDHNRIPGRTNGRTPIHGFPKRSFRIICAVLRD
jgi:thiopurine S-methyltransferase